MRKSLWKRDYANNLIQEKSALFYIYILYLK